MLEYLSEVSPTLRQKDCAPGPIEKIPVPVYQYLPRVLYRKRRDSNISKPPLPMVCDFLKARILRVLSTSAPRLLWCAHELHSDGGSRGHGYAALENFPAKWISSHRTVNSILRHKGNKLTFGLS